MGAVSYYFWRFSLQKMDDKEYAKMLSYYYKKQEEQKVGAEFKSARDL